jgi:hypothetical protein
VLVKGRVRNRTLVHPRGSTLLNPWRLLTSSQGVTVTSYLGPPAPSPEDALEANHAVFLPTSGSPVAPTSPETFQVPKSPV